MPTTMELVATILFATAIVHTFSVPVFARLANRGGPHAGMWNMLSEVEAVFGVWAFVLICFIAIFIGIGPAVEYMDTRNFTEPALDRKSTRLNSSHVAISYAVFCLKKKNINHC